jgi:uncharacterized membrane protein
LKIKIPNYLIIIDVLTLFLILVITFISSHILRIVLGTPFILFFPGYTLVNALFLNKENMGGLEKTALSFTMSIAISGLIGLVLNFSPWGISLQSILYTIAAFILLMSSIAWIRNKRKNVALKLNVGLPGWQGSKLNKSLMVINVVSVLCIIAVVGYIIAKPKIGERFSEFYILGPNGQTNDYPTEYNMNGNIINQVIYEDGTVQTNPGFGTIILEIVNQEQQTTVYSVKMMINGDTVNIDFDGSTNNALGPIELPQGEKWENEIGIVPNQNGDHQKVELLLFKGNETTPEESLYFWIDVKSTG